MEMVVALLIIGLFIGGKFWLIILQKRVNTKEAQLIEQKYYGWMPIALFYYGLLFLPHSFAMILYVALLIIGYLQVFFHHKRIIINWDVLLVSALLTLLFSPFSYFYPLPRSILLFCMMGSAFADISAYSFSKLMPFKHYLPTFINPKKTYEGIIGGLMGSLVALVILKSLNIMSFNELSWLYAASIGLGAVGGDIVNSIVKRKFQVNNWGNLILGHGGVFDRFASFYLALTGVLFIILLLS